MITREQAEKAFHERCNHPQALLRLEIRNLEMIEIDAQQIDSEDNLGVFDIEDRAWKCTVEYRRKQLSRGEWMGTYDEWRKDTCYIVEPKPGAYVID